VKKLIFLVALVLALTLVANSFAEEAKKFKIGALTKSLANPYFLRMKEGYDYAQKKLGVELVFGSTPREEADVEQLNILQSWLAEGSFQGFVVTPFRPTSLNTVLTMVSRKNLPIINIDELIPEEAAAADDIKIATRIASNNVDAGRLQAQLVLASIPKGSDVAVIEGDPGTVSSSDRVRGFTKAAKEGGLNIIASQPAYWNRKKADELAATIISTAPNLRAIAVANDDMALGVIRAVQEARAAGKVVVVSVDGIPEALEAVKEGSLAGTVAQYPDAMAYLAIETMVRALKGEAVPETIDSPIKLITKENLSEAGRYFKDE
jgi:ABC-type sugar transport system substrate-binding protein